jgi:hypothetical protein
MDVKTRMICVLGMIFVRDLDFCRCSVFLPELFQCFLMCIACNPFLLSVVVIVDGKLTASQIFILFCAFALSLFTSFDFSDGGRRRSPPRNYGRDRFHQLQTCPLLFLLALHLLIVYIFPDTPLSQVSKGPL